MPKRVKGRPPKATGRPTTDRDIQQTGKLRDFLDASGHMYLPDPGHGDPLFASGVIKPGNTSTDPRVIIGPGDRPVPTKILQGGADPWSVDDLINTLKGQYGSTGQTIRNSSPIVLPGDKRLPLSNVPLSGGPTTMSNVPLTGGASTLSNVPLSRPLGGLANVPLPGGRLGVTNTHLQGQPLTKKEILNIMAMSAAKKSKGSLAA